MVTDRLRTARDKAPVTARAFQIAAVQYYWNRSTVIACDLPLRHLQIQYSCSKLGFRDEMPCFRKHAEQRWLQKFLRDHSVRLSGVSSLAERSRATYI